MFYQRWRIEGDAVSSFLNGRFKFLRWSLDALAMLYSLPELIMSRRAINSGLIGHVSDLTPEVSPLCPIQRYLTGLQKRLLFIVSI